jgi:hypothetical protein
MGYFQFTILAFVLDDRKTIGMYFMKHKGQ